MPAHLYVKVKHPDHELKVLTVTVELEPQQAYTIRGARVVTLKEDTSSTEASRDAFTPDEFSKKLIEHGFDENEVRFEIEDAIDGMGAGETLL